MEWSVSNVLRFQSRVEKRTCIVLTSLLVIVILIRNAWVCDDAFITFRTIDHFQRGFGLRWNIDERVQAYTHPLWMILMWMGSSLTGEFYWTGILLSIALTTLGVILLQVYFTHTWLEAMVAVFVLLLSKAFMDYSVAGLENPLSHLLLLGFFIFFFHEPITSRTMFYFSLMTSLLLMTRLDLILLVLPAWGLVLWMFPLWRRRHWETIPSLCFGMLPFVLWECFSLLYYGYLIPNPAFAKLHTGIPLLLLIEQGVYYYFSTMDWDPTTLMLMAGALGMVFSFPQKKPICAAVGILLYLLYIILIGGDFMSGRFFTVPVFCSVIVLLSSQAYARGRLCFLFPLVLVLGLSSPYNPVFSDSQYGVNRTDSVNPQGIADERAFDYPSTGLLRTSRTNPLPENPFGFDKKSFVFRSVVVDGHIGVHGFYDTPYTHIVDPFALSDPLLSHLPIHNHMTHTEWRIGHFLREIPEGYTESLSSNRNRIQNPHLAEYYDHIVTITRERLFSWKRMQTILNMNLGRYRHLLEAYLQTLPEANAANDKTQ